MEFKNLPEVPKKETALKVYQIEGGLSPWVEKIRKEVEAFVPDVTTKKGRDAIASVAHKVARSKIALDNIGKELVAELKEIPKKIDAERSRVRKELDTLRDKIRQPLTDWEKNEEEKEVKKRAFIDGLKSHVYEIEGLNSDEIHSVISKLESIEIPNWLGDYIPEGFSTKERELKKLHIIYDNILTQKQHKEEVEKLRAEAIAREQADREAAIAKAAEERVIKAAEDKAEAELAASKQRELELELQAEKAERGKLEAQQREAHAVENEKKRVREEARKAEEERIKREEDKEHRRTINSAAKDDLVASGIDDGTAVTVVTLIAKKLIRNIHIEY